MYYKFDSKLFLILYSVADPGPWNPYHFLGPDLYKKNGWILNPDPHQMIRIRIQLKPWKTVNNFNLFTLI